MNRFALFLALVVPGGQASLLDSHAPVTLDTSEMARIWQEVQGGKTPSPETQPGDSWQAAMLADDAELTCVLLLAWLQSHNPQRLMVEHAADYARALRLHLAGVSGHAAACAELAQAYRSGSLGALALPVSEAKARWFEQRALNTANLPKD